jgi:TRAP-type C4-dicarboxylate transport system permease large subunit
MRELSVAGIGAIAKHLIPFMIVTVVVVFIIAYFPQISLLPVKWVRGGQEHLKRPDHDFAP